MKKIVTRSLLTLAVMLVTASCSSSGGGGSSPTVDVTGSWSGTLTTFGEGDPGGFNLVQDGRNVTGTTQGGNGVTGSVSGSRIRLVIMIIENGDTATIEVSGPVQENSMILTGTAGFTGSDGSQATSPAIVTVTRD